MGASTTILHADLDAYYASVEQLLDPALRGRPIAVGGSASGGVVLAASYEARRFGVSAGMPGWRARQRCPDLCFVRGHFSEYQRIADRVMDVLGDYTPHVERISIDEAFLDVTGSLHLFGPTSRLAGDLRRRVRDEIGLPISVGAARTKHLAKVASQVAKPDGLVVVEPGGEREFLDPLPVGLMWGVGPVTERRLAERGIHTIGELARTPGHSIAALLGEANGARLSALSHDADPRRVQPAGRGRSVGAQSAFPRALPDDDLLREVLGHLTDRIGGRLRTKFRSGRTITVRIRFADMTSITRSRTHSRGISTNLALCELAVALARCGLEDRPGVEINLLAISVSNLVEQHALQLELPFGSDTPLHDGAPLGAARWALDRQMDAVRAKFGRASVGYTSVLLSERATVPEEFRELAERA
ncbi:MAG: DNA polymerase IV [Ilumatobacteraceae bacterium]